MKLADAPRGCPRGHVLWAWPGQGSQMRQRTGALQRGGEVMQGSETAGQDPQEASLDTHMLTLASFQIQ